MEKFDYIIIGAGSAGCVLANRLSENPANSVLLLEAGDRDRNPLIHIPGAYTKLFKQSFDWGFWSEPQTHVNNRKIYLPRGKTLGGCSSTNAMAYVRGNRADYDGWAAMGNEGWSYYEVLPHFKKSESYQQIDQADRHYRGADGELNVEIPENHRTPYSEAFIEAGKQIGLPANDDYNGVRQQGVGRFQMTVKNGKRHSGAVAFLRPALQRPNLTVRTKSAVKKIILKNDQAVGVEFFKNKTQTAEVFANKEVILSAGAFHSPQILMLSGIGEKTELEQQGIDCLKELVGVGKNLQDHLFVPVSASTKQQEGLNHHLKIHNQLIGLGNYLFRTKGPFTRSPLEAYAFFNLDDFQTTPNFQYHFAPICIGKGYDYDMYDQDSFPATDGMTILPSLLHPESRGYVGLRSANPQAAPVIQPNFLSKEADLKALIKGTKIALELIHQPAFDAYRKEILAPLDSSSDEAIAEHIRKSVETIYHPVGTCKMGTDEMAVVDAELRVHGIDGLRVVDASIMPKIVTGNTNAPVYMIAEKAATMILQPTEKRSVSNKKLDEAVS
ncbi:MAG: choline dehydrogenase [Bacteroidota bacterium]